jgi:hypothetical protein
MSYCYCTPSRSLYRDRYPGTVARIAPGTAYAEAPPTDRGYLPAYRADDAVMGSKGDWVERSRREASLWGWRTRRANAAAARAREATAAFEAAQAEVKAILADTVVFVPLVIDAPTAAPETEPVRDLITA